MKDIYIKIMLFLLISIGIYHIRPLYLLYQDKYKQEIAGSEIYYSITKSKSKTKKKKLLLGDSVGKQLFDNEQNQGDIYSLACNGAITMAGQYFLLNNYLHTGNKIDTLYLLYRPLSFEKNMDEKFTYHYFLKPFYNQEYLPLFSPYALNQIAKIPYSSVCRYPTILTSAWAPKFIGQDKNNFSFLSPISIEYLKKIQELARFHHFQLIIRPVPMHDYFKQKITKIDQTEIRKNGFEKEFRNYFDEIIYLADSNFVDSIHLKAPKIYSTHYYKEMHTQ